MVGGKWRGILLAAFIAALPPAGGAAAQDQTPQPAEAIHNDLRALRDRAVAAVNDRKPDALLAELTDDVSFTAMNNEVVHGKAAAKAYYERMLAGSASVLQDMRVTAEPDILSNIHGESAIATGDSMASFKLRGGLEFTAPLRWTASLVHENGAWKIAAMHFSANVFDNPVDAGIRKYFWIPLVTVGLVGILLGFILGRARRRRA